MPCYSTHSKYLPAQKPHRWQSQDNIEPSNLLDYSWFIPWQPLQRCSFLHHIVWVKTAMRHLYCTVHIVRRMCCDRSLAMKSLLRSINVVWLADSLAPKRSHGVISWHHVASLFAKSLWNHITQCYEIIIMHDRDVGVPCHCIVFQSIHQGFPQFRNEIIFIWQHDSNFKPGLVHCFPLHPSTTPGISLTRPVWETLTMCECVRERACVCVIAHYGIKEWVCGSKIECETITFSK